MNGVVPYKGEFAVLWNGYLYPYRKASTADMFYQELKAGIWNDSQLDKFERYHA